MKEDKRFIRLVKVLGNSAINYLYQKRENKIYDIGTKVYANGNMALNGNSINNNYILENVGKYQLAITSVNGENTYISFEVSDLSEREMVNDNKKEIKKCAYLNFEETKNYLAKAEYDVKLYENKENIKYALIFILIILTILSFYLMYKNKKKKGDLK